MDAEVNGRKECVGYTGRLEALLVIQSYIPI
jgi:hypothetical protein